MDLVQHGGVHRVTHLFITLRPALKMNSAKTLVLLLIFTAFFDASAGEDRPLQAQRPSPRQDVARRVFAEHPEMSRQNRRESILKGIIEMGMTPYEAKLAGGEFSYKVISDSAIWVPNADPIKVMWTQSIRPDESRIWMTFWNTSQFETAMDRTFTVYFVDGKAQSITQPKE